MELKEFKKHIENIQQVYENEAKLCRILKCNSPINFADDIADSTLELLKELFNDTEDEWIEYWMFDLDFGEKWRPGMVEIKGQDIKLQTIEDLYGILNK